jgi:hypothetical protein
MNDDLEGTPGTTDDGGSQGQSEAGAKVQVTDADLRNLQSVYDRKLFEVEKQNAEAIRRAEKAERESEQIKAQASAVINSAKARDPEEANVLILEAAKAQKDEELRQLREEIAERDRREEVDRRAREQNEAAMNGWKQIAVGMGIDPLEPEFQQALSRTFTDGNTQHAFGAITKIVARKASTQTTAPEPDYVSPPSGGTPRPNLKQADKEAIHAELNELYREPTKNKARITALKAKLG